MASPHGSKPNAAIIRGIGFAVRYIAPEVVQHGAARQIVQLVRGQDTYGHFEVVAAPTDAATATAIRQEADRRVLSNILPETKPAAR